MFSPWGKTLQYFILHRIAQYNQLIVCVFETTKNDKNQDKKNIHKSAINID